MKKCIVILFTISVFLCFAGCGASVKRTENYLEIYSDFLSYSLGEFTVISESTESRYAMMAQFPTYYTRWTLQYTRYDGEVRNFSFDNQFDNGLGEDYYMGNSLVSEAGLIWLDRIKQDVTGYYFAAETMDPFANFTLDEIDSSYPITLTRLEIELQLQKDSNSRDFADMLNPQSGLQLYSITLPELQSNWNFAFLVSVSTIDSENHLSILKQFKEMIKKLSEYSGHDHVLVDFRVSTEEGMVGDSSFFGYYDKQTDTFNLTYR